MSDANYNYKEPFKRIDFSLGDSHGRLITYDNKSIDNRHNNNDNIRSQLRSVSHAQTRRIDSTEVDRNKTSHQQESGCFCCDSDEDSIDRMRFQHAKGKCVQKCFRICLLSCLIIGYTFVGAVIFLATEDQQQQQQTVDVLQQTQQHQSTVSSMATMEKLSPLFASPNESTIRWLTELSAENRAKTVQNIWDITVNLNILYRDNWTRLASKELNMFQERLLELLWQEKYLDGPVFSQDTQRIADNSPTHWKLGKAFLYSISILATIGYGGNSNTSKSITEKLIVMIYTAFGLPVMFMYLSSMGSLLSTCAQHVFSRTLCCCLCSKCGYCCYDEKLMEEKEKRTKRKRQMCSGNNNNSNEDGLLSRRLSDVREPFFVVDGCCSTSVDERNAPYRQQRTVRATDKFDNEDDNATITITADNEYSRFLAPLFVCLCFTLLYVLFGSFVLYQLDRDWTFIDSVYFCFMLVSTIGLDDSVPAASALSPRARYDDPPYGVLLVWFFSVYIFFGLGLSATCFNIIHDGLKRKITELYLYSDKKLKKSSLSSGPSTRYENTSKKNLDDIS